MRPLRAVRLAAWGTAFLQDETSVDEAVAAVETTDEPHLVVEHPLDEPVELEDALLGLHAQGVRGLRLALPAPGDLLGLAGPPALNMAALAAGEAVVAVLDRRLTAPGLPALVPDVTTFGPPGDQGHCVTWRGMEASATPPDVPSLGEADRDLRATLRQAADDLERLDAPAWGTAGRQVRAPALRLPDSLGPRAQLLAQQAVRLLGIVDAARADDGGTVTAHAAASRLTTLGPLDRAARRALVAACAAALEPARR